MRKLDHACPLGRSSEKKLPAGFLFWFLLHMTPRLWEDVLELQKQAKFKDNVIFSAQGGPIKTWGKYFYVNLKKKVGPLSSLFLILAFFGLKNAFFFILHLIRPEMTEGPKITVKGPKVHFLDQNRKKWRKWPQLIFRFYMKICPPTFLGGPLGWENDIIF